MVRARSNEKWARPIDVLDDEFNTRWADMSGSSAVIADFRGRVAQVLEEIEPILGEEDADRHSFIDDFIQKQSASRDSD